MRPLAVAVLGLLAGASGGTPGDAIVSFCGGGFTGGGSGTRIDASGAMTDLRRAHAGAALEEARIADRTAPYARIAALLDAAGFAAMPGGAPSNMTCSLTWWRGGQSRRVMWPSGQPPAALQAALREIAAAGR